MTNSRNSNQLIPYARSAMVPMGLYALDALLRQTPGVITAGANALGRGATNYLSSVGNAQTITTVPSRGSKNFQVMNGRSQSSKKSRNRHGKNSRAIPRSPSRQSIRAVFPAFYSPTNGGTGAMAIDYWLGYKNTNSNGSLGTTSTPFGSLCNTFQTVAWHSVKVSYIPTCSDSTTGSLALCFNPNHKQMTTTFYQQGCIERRGVLTDVKAPITFNWTPDTEQERESKNTDEASTIALTAIGEGSLRAFSPGYLRFYSDNSLAQGGQIGNFLIEADVTFSDLY